MSDDKLKELSELIGIDPSLIKEIGAEDLSKDKMELITNVFSLYLEDKEAFSDFLSESGIEDLLANLNQDKIQNAEEAKELKENLNQLIKDNDLDIDLDL